MYDDLDDRAFHSNKKWTKKEKETEENEQIGSSSAHR